MRAVPREWTVQASISRYRLVVDPFRAPGDRRAASAAFADIERALVRLDPDVVRAVREIHQALFGAPIDAPQIDSTVEHSAHLEKMLRDLSRSRVHVSRVEPPKVGEAPVVVASVAPAPRSEPAARDESPRTTWFEVKLVDELGEAIDGVEVIFSSGGVETTIPTGGDGVARLEDATTSFASARVASIAALRDAVKPRWDEAREGETLEPNAETTCVFLRGNHFDSIGLDREKPRTISVQPYVLQAQLFGVFFDTNKNFLLPTALPSISKLKKIYDQNANTELLIVGHTDTSGDPSYNDALSLERADAVAQYLTDDAAAWLDRYGSSVPAAKRWGKEEDLLMIRAMPDFAEKPPNENAVRWYQRTRGLKVDGDAGPKTREKLIAEYMSFDQTTLPEGITPVTHGCGEHFPLDESGEGLDTAPKDGAVDQTDRRVELFFFDKELGIQPPPPSQNSQAGSAEYPEWVRRARDTKQLGVDPEPVLLELEWAEDLAAAMPESLVIVLAREGADPIEKPLESAARSEGVVRLSFAELGREEMITLSAKTDEEELVLVREQRAGDVDTGFEWEHRLDELLRVEESEPEKLVASGGASDFTGLEDRDRGTALA